MSFALTWEEWYLSGCVRFLPRLSRKRSARSICLIRYLKYINLLSIRLRWFLLFRLIIRSIAFEKNASVAGNRTRDLIRV